MASHLASLKSLNCQAPSEANSNTIPPLSTLKSVVVGFQIALDLSSCEPEFIQKPFA